MITIPGELGKDLCDPHLKVTRRDLLRIGGSSCPDGLTLSVV